MGEPTTTSDKRVRCLLFNVVSSILRASRGNAKERRERRPDTHQLGWRVFEIQHFAIQAWRAAQEIVMEHVPGQINPSDSLTKAVGWTLHHRHSLRGMGHFEDSQGLQDVASDPPPSHEQGRVQEAGEGVGA